MRRLPLAVALAIPVVSLIFAHHLSATTSWIEPFEAAISLALALSSIGTIVALLAGWKRLSLAIPIALLAANTAYMIGRTAGVHHMGALPPPDAKFALILSGAMVLAACGLVARRHWARWIALAFGAAAIGCGGLNLIYFWRPSGTPNVDFMNW